MEYRRLLVHLEVGRPNTSPLLVAGDIADRFNASVIGIAACRPAQIVLNAAYISNEIVEQDRAVIEGGIAAAEDEFRSALHRCPDRIEFRSAVMLGPLHEFLVEESRSADLIITGAADGRFENWSRHANNRDLVMLAGRPVLIVPVASTGLKLHHALIAWKDTREARRAVADALPLLRHADRVTIVEIAMDQEAAREHVEEVSAWLNLHGIKADTFARTADGSTVIALEEIAMELGADLIVAGAYGHSRLREWALGGVTCDLLTRSPQCVLVSH